MLKGVLKSFLILSLLFLTDDKESTYERVVVTSIPSDTWYKNIYLLADKKSWMDYVNFTVQVGDRGELMYHFPDWYSGKYSPDLYSVDLSGDELDDIIVVLNHSEGGVGLTLKYVHVLNQIKDPYVRYEEVSVEPIEEAIKRLASIDKKEDIVTLYADSKKYKIDITDYNFENPRNPHIVSNVTSYTIEDRTLKGITDIRLVADNFRFSGGLLGYLFIDYEWDGEAYKAASIEFKQIEPEEVSR